MIEIRKCCRGQPPTPVKINIYVVIQTLSKIRQHVSITELLTKVIDPSSPGTI